MNAAMHLSQPPLSASSARSASPASFDADRAGDLYAIWKAVFERARPVEASDDRTHLSAAGERALQGGSNPGSDMHGGLAYSRTLLSTDAPALRESIAHPSTCGGSASAITHAELNPPSAARQPVAAQAALRSAGSEADCILPCNGRTWKSSGETTSHTAAAQPASTDSVNVFVQGASVAIVVRDAALSEQEAVRCAFETARKLTGQRGSLQQLTLNGRTLYQQHSDPNTRAAPPMAALVFAC